MKKKLIWALVILVAIVALICVFSSFYTVAENEYACVLRFSKVIETVDEAGIHFKVPFIDSIRVLPRTIQHYDIPPSEVLTADKKNMTVDSYVLWTIDDPLTFIKTLGSIGEAEKRLDAVSYNALKNVMGTLEQNKIINQDDGAERNEIYAQITNSVSGVAQTYGIEIVDVKVKRLDLPADNEEAVYTRMISERNQMAEKYKADGELEASKITNDVDREVNIIVSNAAAAAAKLEAEGEQEYMKMLAEAFNTEDKRDFYEFIIALDALKTSLNGNDKTIILGKESALAQILTGPNFSNETE